MELTKGIFLVFALIIAVNLVHFASAEILLSQPNAIYNVGNRVSVQATVKPAMQTEDYLSVKLICDSQLTEIFRNYYVLNANEEKRIDTIFPIVNISGTEDLCYISVSFGDENSESARFKASNEVLVSANLPKRTYDPGEEITITGQAKKTDGANVDGFAELTGNFILNPVRVIVSEGNFQFNYSATREVSGVKNLNVYVYEKNIDNEVTNYGDYNLEVEIRPVLSKIEVSLSQDSIIPGSSISYDVETLDQESKVISSDVIVSIVNPDGTEHYRNAISANNSNEFVTSKNYLPGYWKIEVSSGDISGKKLLYIEELEEASFEVANATITVENIGNVKYNKVVRFKIGDNEVVKEVSLKVGETKRYELSAPDGDYQIEIDDGESSTSFGSVPLTGKSINLGEIKGLKGIFEVNGILIIFIVLILGLFAAVFAYRNGFILNRKNNSFPSSMSEDYVEPSSIVGHGVSQQAAVVCLDVRNQNKNGLDSIEKAIEAANSRGASVHVNGEQRVMVFAPIVTKSNDNLQLALKTGKEIENTLQEHNRRNRDKIDFGIGVNNGEIIAEKKPEGLGFISKGNLIREAKRISKEAKCELLFSESAHRGLVQNAEFKKDAEKNAWKAERIKGNENYKEFVDKFTEKNFGQKKD